MNKNATIKINIMDKYIGLSNIWCLSIINSASVIFSLPISGNNLDEITDIDISHVVNTKSNTIHIINIGNNSFLYAVGCLYATNVSAEIIAIIKGLIIDSSNVMTYPNFIISA